ncbi:unnamed protein product [Caenorhabditis nigoni]
MNVLREFSARLNGASVRDHILRMVLRIIRQQVTRNEEQIENEDNKENIRPSNARSTKLNFHFRRHRQHTFRKVLKMSDHEATYSVVNSEFSNDSGHSDNEGLLNAAHKNIATQVDVISLATETFRAAREAEVRERVENERLMELMANIRRSSTMVRVQLLIRAMESDLLLGIHEQGDDDEEAWDADVEDNADWSEEDD